MANSSEINRALKTHRVTGTIFQGCFPAERFPLHEKIFPLAVIMNTDDSTLPGKHWVAFYAKDDEHLEMFDSFGNAPSRYKQFDYFIKEFDFIQYNGSRVQEYFSSACGYYCMVFVLFRSKGFSITDFVQLFTDDCRNNDQVVTGFVNRTWKFNKSVYASNCLFQMSKQFVPER